MIRGLEFVDNSVAAFEKLADFREQKRSSFTKYYILARSPWETVCSYVVSFLVLELSRVSVVDIASSQGSMTSRRGKRGAWPAAAKTAESICVNTGILS